MTALTGVVSTWPGRRWWERLAQPVVELAPDHALFILRRTDHALRRVELTAGETRTVELRGDELGLVLRRDFGLRLTVACEFASAGPGTIEAEIRLRVLAGGTEWPRLLPSEEPVAGTAEDPLADEVLARLISRLFVPDLARVFQDQPYAGLQLRLHDPALVGQVEAAVRAALHRPAEDRVLALRSVELLAVHCTQAEDVRADEREAAALIRQAESRDGVQERMDALTERRLARALRLKQMQAAAEAEAQRSADRTPEVRWRLFAPADLQAPGAQPPRLQRESSERNTSSGNGCHLQLLVQPSEPSFVHVLSLGPYRTGAGAEVEYRWLRLLGNGGATELVQRPPRAAGNRVVGDELLIFPGDAGAAELFQHYLTFDSTPGADFIIAALTPHPLLDNALSGALPLPTASAADPAFPDRLESELRGLFGTGARLYIFRFSHSS